MANKIVSDLRSTIEFIASSTENLDSPLQVNAQQCKLLAKKVHESLNILAQGKFQEVLQDHLGQENISSTVLAAKELFRVITDAKNLITDWCDDRWLKVITNRGTMKEAFRGLVDKIQFYTSLLNSTLMITDGKSDIVHSGPPPTLKRGSLLW